MQLNSFSDCVARYGKPWESQQAQAEFEKNWMILSSAPSDMPFHRAYYNRDLAPMINKTIVDLRTQGCLNEIKTFDGCFEIRKIRGSLDRWSQHSFGTAIDLNAGEMPLGSASLWTPRFIMVMKANGWTWGGDFKRLDPMHFQLAKGC